MKSFIKKHGAIAAKLGAVAAMVASPLSAFAAFSDGMVIPAGTTTNVTESLDTYFFTTVLKTVFQAQVIQIVVVLAAVAVMWLTLKIIIRKVMHPGR